MVWDGVRRKETGEVNGGEIGIDVGRNDAGRGRERRERRYTDEERDR